MLDKIKFNINGNKQYLNWLIEYIETMWSLKHYRKIRNVKRNVAMQNSL